MQRTDLIRRLPVLAAIPLAGAALTGCDYWLIFESGGNELAEELFCPDCPEPPSSATVAGSGGGGGGSSSGGGTASAPADDQGADKAEAPAREATPGTATIVVAGRVWTPAGVHASPAPGKDAVLLRFGMTVAGHEGEAAVLIPIEDWPKNAEGEPLALDWKGEAAPASFEPSMTRQGALLAGRAYTAQIISARTQRVSASQGERVRGVIEAHIWPEGDDEADARKQLFKASFEVAPSGR